MPIKKLSPDSAISDVVSFKPKPNSVYLGIVVFNHKQQVLLSPSQQLPTLPLFTRDRLAYHSLTLNSPNFHAIVQWSQMTNTSSTDHLSLQQRNFISHFAYTHGKLMQYIGCDPQQGSFYRHVLEFQRPNFKLLLMLYPFHQLTLTQPPLSRTSRLHWYPSKGLEHLSFLSSQHVTRPTTLWRQPQSVHYAQTSRLPRGLYLALFYCQSSPPNNQRGLQIFLEKHHEHRLPCVPLRLDTRITNVEWEWLQTLAQPGYDDDDDEKGQHGIKTPTMGFSETYDFLTKEMQQKQQEHQLAIQQQLAPFQQALRQGRNQLQAMAGVPIQLKDLFSEDSLCMMYDDDVDETKVPDDTTKTLKKKTLSITDMFTYGQLQTQHGWNRPVHVRMLVIVKPLCITPDFPVQPNFDFYPYHVFRTLHQDKMYFSAASLDSPRRQPQHHVSMSDLLNNTTTDITKRPTKRRSVCAAPVTSALFYQDKDMKGWTGRLLAFDRQRIHKEHRTSRITSTCSLPIAFSTPCYDPPCFSKRLKRWWLARRRKS